ncbi:predicted protein [Bathycoccus prasinos]|uniref:Beta-lactamase-related domain-containing protein n=1 Tax=Bathycoccus prasinos TaxID=41875 RepID=K8E8T1_9CHLO|nr:predicted protein [Bathycoccus prasinos]CCO14016.1 predicted protein [Bathycoccus prasinos]|eukprot:XP_007515137.1 predicted protein [Bathycoccus prasinos]
MTFFFAVVSSSLLFLIILDLATSITGVHAQKELASFEEQNPSSSLGKTTTRTTPETIAPEDDDDSAQKDAHGSEGGGEWQFATPASKGLSQSSLETADARLSVLPGRDCFLVAKDGAIVHENYPGFASSPNAKRTTDTSGALLSLAMIGAAVKDGLIELDQPLLDYTPLAVEIFGKDTTVTARHILQQTHGGAVEENQRANKPGQEWDLDDSFDRDHRNSLYLKVVEDAIQHAVFRRVKRDAKEWATKAVLEPLGLQEAFLNGDDQTDGEFSLTGRFSLSCRDALKLAQLFLNKGVTLDKTGHSIQLFNKDFAYEVFTQTEQNDKHGLLTWVHQPLEKDEKIPKKATCCSPVALGSTPCGHAAKNLRGPLFGASTTSFVAMTLGDKGSAIFMLPKENIAIVTFGRTSGETGNCESYQRDDTFLAHALWGAAKVGLEPDTIGMKGLDDGKFRVVDGEPHLSALAQQESGIQIGPDGKEKMNTKVVIDPESGRPKRVPIGDGTVVTTADGRKVQEYEEDREIHDQVWKEMIGGYYVEAVNSAAEFLQEHKKAVKAGQDVYGSMQRWQDAIHMSKHEPTVVEEEYYKEQGIDPKFLKTPMAELEEAAAKTVAAKKKAGDEDAKFSAVPEYPAVQHAQPHEYSVPSLGSAQETKKTSWFRQVLTPTQNMARMAVVGDVPVRVMMMGAKKDTAKLGDGAMSSEEAASLGESPYVHQMRQRNAQRRVFLQPRSDAATQQRLLASRRNRNIVDDEKAREEEEEELNSENIQRIERNIHREESREQRQQQQQQYNGNLREENDEREQSVLGDDKSRLRNGINLAPQRLTDAPIRSNNFEDSPSAYGSCSCACPGKADEAEHHCYDVVDETPNGDASMACDTARQLGNAQCPTSGVVNACVESSKGVLLGPEQHPDQSCKQTRACPDASANASELERSFVAEVYECQAVRYASCSFSVNACKKSTMVLRRANTEMEFAATNGPVVIRVPATGAQEQQQRQQLPQRTWTPRQQTLVSSSSYAQPIEDLTDEDYEDARGEDFVEQVQQQRNDRSTRSSGKAYASKKSSSSSRSSSKVQEALKETSGTVDKPLTKAPRRAGKTSAPSSSKESSPSVGKKESSSVKSSSNNKSSSKSSSSSKKIVSPHDLTEAIEMDIRKKTREKPRNREEAFVQWAEYSPPFIAIGTACVALAVALLAIARKYPSSVSHPWAIPGVLQRQDVDEETGGKGNGRPPLPSRAAYGTANDAAAYSEKLSSPRTPEFKQSEKERIRLAQEERERLAAENIRAEFEKENEERKKRFEQELDALKKEREAFEAMKKEEDRKRKEKRERKERELKRAKEEKEMENKLSQAKKDAMAAAREIAREETERVLSKPTKVVKEEEQVEVEDEKKEVTTTSLVVEKQESVAKKKGFFNKSSAAKK